MVNCDLSEGDKIGFIRPGTLGIHTERCQKPVALREPWQKSDERRHHTLLQRVRHIQIRLFRFRYACYHLAYAIWKEIRSFPARIQLLYLSDHPKPASDYHLKTGQRE